MDSIMQRIRYKTFQLTCLLLSLFALPVYAQALTLPEALILAEQHSPALRVASGQQHSSVAALDTARAFPNPEIEYGSGRSHLMPTTPQPGRNRLLAFSQPLELPSVRGARQRAAEAGIVSGSALLDDARLNVYAQVKQAFLDIQRRESESQLAEESRALLGQIHSRVKLRVEVGEASRYELIKATAEMLAAENVAQSAEIKVTQAKDRLRALLGTPLGDTFDITPAPLLPEDLPAIASLREELLTHQPLLKAAVAETQRATAKLEQERSLRIPQPTLKWSAEQHPDVNLWRIGVALPLPLWDRRAGPIGEAQANLERAEAEQERIRFNVLNELDQAYGRYQIAQRQLYIFETGLMQGAETALKVAEAAYRYGERGILDYLDAQRVVRSTRMDYLNARYELQFALVDIERLRGTLLAGEHP
ncbi:Cobalt-zinc-cadmium resistance protein CzcC [Ferriphaselus amnicola]|uniref:Cobalt-zinc-cadmium resistance protein CzcC n=2 Tax=Ferriphaselus amnicola TaxID=1188319 RepID=A0A2Z6G8S4_9PROT|nr:Cobalt-zinc-cadmium resistance protein CzcC [Ferriphaselus amnicola]